MASNFDQDIDRSDDGFEAAYAQGMPVSLLPEAGQGFGAEVDRRALAAAGPIPGAAPDGAIALGGTILTPDGPLRGWITVAGGQITALGTRRPPGAKPLATGGVILPGLIDLHGHPEFNVFAPWEPPKTYLNRYAWRGDDLYKKLIRQPQDQLKKGVPAGTQLRYAEIRALVGGVTAIQGASFQTQRSNEALVRNVDGIIFGEHRARAVIDLPASLDAQRGGDELRKTLTAIAAGEVAALYVHLAEGQRNNQRSIDEFDHLATTLTALTAATVIIHGSALSRDQLGAAKDAGAKLVWSPQSNLRLYRETTRAADALDVGLPVALGADWLPSGSTSLLAEMKVARQELLNQGRPPQPRQLVDMVTTTAASVAGLGDRLGSLQPGRPADLVVLARTNNDPYESVCGSSPTEVELVLIGGQISYGRSDWVRQLSADPADPALTPVLAWGRPMLLNTGQQGSNGRDGDFDQLRSSLVNAYPQVGPIWA